MTALNIEQRSSLLEGLQTLCSLFWGPEPDSCRALLQGKTFRFARALESLQGGLLATLSSLEAYGDGYGEARILCQALEEQYVHLFISRKGGIKAPLYHSCHVSENAPLMGPPARMMIGRLQAAGLDLAAGLKDPPDHIAIEGEYLYFLLETGWREQNPEVIDLARNFAEKEMLPWVRVFHAKLAEEPEGRFYAPLAELFCHLLQIIAEYPSFS